MTAIMRSALLAGAVALGASQAYAAEASKPGEADEVARIFCHVEEPPETGPQLQIERDAYVAELRCAVDYAKWLMSGAGPDHMLHVLALNESVEGDRLMVDAHNQRHFCESMKEAGMIRKPDNWSETNCPGF